MNPSLETLSENRCFGGIQGNYRHHSEVTGTPMRFSVYCPPQADHGAVPVLWYLSGLTCTEENVTVKAGAQRYAAEHGLILVAPDTSPRGDDVPDDPECAYDFGLGAGFYVDAIIEPYSCHYRMYSYIVEELPRIIVKHFPANLEQQGITGHSMGGHGALTVALKNPGTYRSVSAFAPICSPSQCPWGEKALAGYLGENRATWKDFDAVRLIENGARTRHIKVDQGTADQFLAQQLKPELLRTACTDAGIALDLQMRAGYDHSYYFIASFIGEHIHYHAKLLRE